MENSVMPTIVVDAVYENGVFKPLNQVHLPEGHMVKITIKVPPAKPKTPEEVQEMAREARQVFEGFTDEEIDDISQAWKRKS